MSSDWARFERRLPRWVTLATLGLAAGVTFACGDDSFSPLTAGSLRVQWVTTGGDLDLDGYALTVDEGLPLSMAVHGSLRLESLDAGEHVVALGGLAPNCTVVGANPLIVTVEAGATTQAAFAVACVATGVWVAITTTGLDLPASYEVTVDDAPATTAPATSSASISRLSAGGHSVALGGVPANCNVAGSNPLSVSLVSGVTLVVTFAISCGAATATIAVSTATTGLDAPDHDYALRVDGVATGAVGTNGARVITGVSAGSHTVELADVPSNCTVAGDNPVMPSVTTGGMTRDTAEVAFEVSCVMAASIVVSAATSGFDGPRADYTLHVDGVAAGSVPRDGSTVIDGFSDGDHSVELVGVPTNCTLVGAHPVTVTLTTGGMTRDTADVAFEIDCVKVWGLAFARTVAGTDGQASALHVARADGSEPTFVAWGWGGEWSPGGERIAFEACEWSDYYAYYYELYSACITTGVGILNTRTSVVTALTSDFSDTDPTWHPDGATIAFSRNGRLFFVSSNGSGLAPVPMPTTVSRAFHPSWSPDGSTLAFTCELTLGSADICLVKPDGTGFVQLTADPGREARPAWRPDGSSIAFSSTALGGTTDIVLMSPAGSTLATLSPGMGATHPAWSVDGTVIAFAGVSCNVYTGCRRLGLFRMNADGTGVAQLTTGASDEAPAWRP